MTASADAAVGDAAARDLLVDLVSIPSPPGEECACAERLAEFFADAGREVEVDAVGNVRAPADDALLLTSHVDTVPGEIPVRVEADVESGADGDREDGDVLRGRGSVDAKGALAAMAVAAVRTGVSFAGVVGEETDSRGARHLVADRDPPGALVNGEPSGWDAVTLGYRGFLSGEYAVATDSAHTSRPEPNAVQRAMAWWSQVEDVFASEGPVFERVTAKPVAVEAGTVADGLSVEATVAVEFRIPPSESAASVRETVEALAEAGDLAWHEPIPPATASPRTDVVRAFRAAIREAGGDPRLLRKTGTSDVNIYAATWDCPMATYGPGDSDLDHAPDERLDLAAFDRAVEVLERVAGRLQS